MGVLSSKGSRPLPEEGSYFGLENFGNTCYCNAVLQALYFTLPFRRHVIAYYLAWQARKEKTSPLGWGAQNQGENLLTALGEMFHHIQKQKNRTGTYAPKRFLLHLRKANPMFKEMVQQDAHEFLGFLLNEISELLLKAEEEEKEKEREQLRRQLPLRQQERAIRQEHQRKEQEAMALATHRKQKRELEAVIGTFEYSGNQGVSCSSSSMLAEDSLSEPSLIMELPSNNNSRESESSGGESGDVSGNASEDDVEEEHKPRKTFIQAVFEGILTNETKCMCCEQVKNKNECFLDLSLDIEHNSSVSHCLRSFSHVEMLDKEDKFFCECCNSLQEAQKRLKIKELPHILIVHLKRFKFTENYQFRKLSYCVSFPFEMRLTNTCQDTVDKYRFYDLYAIVVHIGSSPYSGHYICFVKSQGTWLVFDDDYVSVLLLPPLSALHSHLFYHQI
ncbi:hypothetical protein QOT17_001207 [Balamuthia mandrillaris]